METPEEVATAVAGLAELIEEIPGQAGNDEEGQAGNDEGGLAGNDEEEPNTEEISPRAALGRNDKEEPASETVNEPEPETEPEPEPTPEPEKVEEIPDQVGKDEEDQVGKDEVKPKKSHRKLWRWILIVLGVLVGLLLIFVLLSRLAPGLLDPLLYSKEELQILRY